MPHARVTRSGLDGRSASSRHSPAAGELRSGRPHGVQRDRRASALRCWLGDRPTADRGPATAAERRGQGRSPSRDTWKTHPTPRSRSPRGLEGFVGMHAPAFLSGLSRQEPLPLPPRPPFPVARELSLLQQRVGWGPHTSRGAAGTTGRCLPAVSWRPRQFGRTQCTSQFRRNPSALPDPLPLPSRPSAGAALGDEGKKEGASSLPSCSLTFPRNRLSASLRVL